MAKDGTSVPADAAAPRTIPSVPRPDQMGENISDDYSAPGGSAGAADNATDIPRTNRDIGVTGEVVSGTGDQLPSTIETKHLYFERNPAASKGNMREDKQAKQMESNEEMFASEGPGVDPAPGEEGEGQAELRDKREGEEV